MNLNLIRKANLIAFDYEWRDMFFDLYDFRRATDASSSHHSARRIAFVVVPYSITNVVP